MLVGIVAYRQLPLSALPEVDYPTIQVVTLYPGASPGGDDVVGHRPARATVRPDAGTEADVVDQLRRRVGHHAAVRPRAVARHRRAAGSGSDQRRRQPVAGRPAEPADLQQGQSGRHADHRAGRHVEDAVAAEGAGPRRHAHRAEDLAAPGRRPRQPVGRSAARRAHPGQSEGHRRARARARRRAGRDREREHQPGERQFRRADARVDDRCERPAALGRRVPQPDPRVQERVADPAARRGRHRGRRGEHAARRVGQPEPRDHRQRAAPARRERDRRGRPHQEAAAATAGVAARRRST